MQIISGDIRQIEQGLVMHQVNCQNVMGSGVARALYQKYPRVKSEYHSFCQDYQKPYLLGSLQEIKINDRLTVINSFTQYDYGRNKNIVYTSEDLLIQNIKNLDFLAKERKVLAFVPYKIGCGLANGNWETILNALKETNIFVVQLER